MTTEKNFFTRNYVVIIGSVMCTLLWGSAFPCLKIGYDLFGIDTESVPSIMLYAGLRFTLAGILVIAFACITSKRFVFPKRGNIWRVCVLSLFQTIGQYIFFYIGVANTSGVKSSVISGLGVFITILAACFLFRTEKFSLVKLAGCLLGFGGVLLINLGGSFTWDFTFRGEGCVILSSVCGAIAAGLMKIFSTKDNPSVLCGYQFFLGGIVLIAVGLISGGRVSPTGVSSYLMLLYLAFISSFAYAVQGYLLKYNPVSRIEVYKSLNPLFGSLFSAIILSEWENLLSWTTIAALACICLGIVVINLFGERRIRRRGRDGPPGGVPGGDPAAAEENPAAGEPGQEAENTG